MATFSQRCEHKHVSVCCLLEAVHPPASGLYLFLETLQCLLAIAVSGCFTKAELETMSLLQGGAGQRYLS